MVRIVDDKVNMIDYTDVVVIKDVGKLRVCYCDRLAISFDLKELYCTVKVIKCYLDVINRVRDLGYHTMALPILPNISGQFLVDSLKALKADKDLGIILYSEG